VQRRSLRPVLTAAACLSLIGGLTAGCTSGGGTSSKPSAQPSGSVGAPSGSGVAALPAKQILSDAEAAATAAGSLHFSSATKEGSTSIDFTDDSSASGGRQVITLSDGGQMTVLVVSGVGYVNGNAEGLAGFLGMSEATATELAGKWIAVNSASPYYQQVVTGVTISSVLGEFAPVGRLTSTARQTVDGQSVIGVRGTASSDSGLPADSTVTLYVAATGRPLPVSCIEGAGADKNDVTFGHWGEPVSVSPPSATVPAPAPAPSQPVPTPSGQPAPPVIV
jgi:hypothetical protein